MWITGAVTLVASLAGAAIGALWEGPVEALIPLVAGGLVGVWCAWILEEARWACFFTATGFLAVSAAMATLDAKDARVPPLAASAVERGIPIDGTQLFVVEGRMLADARAEAQGRVILRVAVERLSANGRRWPTRGVADVSVNGTLGPGLADRWRSGRDVVFPATLRVRDVARNPGAVLDPVRLGREAALIGSVKSGAVVEVASAGSPWDESKARIRARARVVVARAIGRYSAESAALADAILIGDRSGLSAVLEERMKRAGTYHLIAISGGNLAIFGASTWWVLRTLGVGLRIRAVVCVVVLLIYAAIVGPEPSVVRATFMAVAYLLSRAAGLRAAPGHVLGGAACVVLWFDGLAVFEAGAWLTFAAAAGIALGMQRTRGLLDRLEEAVASHGRESSRTPGVASRVMALGIRIVVAAVLVTVSAELAVLPIAARFFSQITFVGLISNLVAVPLMAFLQVASLAAVAVASASDGAASIPGLLAHEAARGAVAVGALAERLPFLVRFVPPPPFILVAAYYAPLLGAAFLRGRTAWRCGAASAAALAAIVGGVGRTSASATDACPGFRGRPPAGNLTVTFLDVGQGDSALIRFGRGPSWLVDAGGVPESAFDVGRRVVAPALWALGVRSLDTVVVSHGDIDHVGGAASICEIFSPRAIWEGVPVPSHAALARLRSWAAANARQWWNVQREDHVTIGRVDVRVVHPPIPDWERQRARNEDSVVLELRLGQVSVLLTGDMGGEAESVLAPRIEWPGVRVLKVGHHGSRGSTTPPFAAAAAPSVAVVSVGARNRFGHPAPDVISRLEQAGAGVFRTDREGAVEVTTDGEGIRVRTCAGRIASVSAPLPPP